MTDAKGNTSATEAFRTARDFLLAHRGDYARAYQGFAWPALDDFNWALDWFDVIAASNERPALWVVEEDGAETKVPFAAMSSRSSQLAAWLRSLGIRRGDRLLLVLGNRVELWETMLAAIKLGAVVIPATTLLTAEEVADRIERGNVRHVVAEAAQAPKFAGLDRLTRIAVGGTAEGWLSYGDAATWDTPFVADGPTRAGDPMLLYFTSGTTAKPKLVLHTHTSYPVGHLSTMYWVGLQPGDVHLNISSPGWAKHAWSSVFAPWNAEATVLVFNYGRFPAQALLDLLVRAGVTCLCAPPTVWRMLIQEDMASWSVPLREVVGAGEPLNPEVIEHVQRVWGITIRDGYGQTETTAQIGNTPGQPVKPGSMGRVLPGYRIGLLDPLTDKPAADGEIGIDLSERPVGLMTGYLDDPDRTDEVMRHGYYHTGDVASIDDEGYITYVGRTDDVFKASDYRISPFELESVLIEHEAVAEAAVVPSPDPIRLAVPKAFIVLAAGAEPNRATALSILQHARRRLAPYKRVRGIEFADLPKTISGKIRRVELREKEAGASRSEGVQFWEEEFPELRSAGRTASDG